MRISQLFFNMAILMKIDYFYQNLRNNQVTVLVSAMEDLNIGG